MKPQEKLALLSDLAKQSPVVETALFAHTQAGVPIDHCIMSALVALIEENQRLAAPKPPVDNVIRMRRNI